MTSVMRRRGFLSGALTLLVTPFAVEAQQAGKPSARIGFVGNSDPQTWPRQLGAFLQGLRDLGWIEGQNMSIEYRWAEGKVERLPAFAAELVRLKVDAVVAAGAPALRAFQRATSTMPIVSAVLLTDPVRAGFVASLARPGGNITGLASEYEEIITVSSTSLVRPNEPRTEAP